MLIAYAGSQRVRVQIFMEAGCPFCSKYLASPQQCRSAAKNATALALAQYDLGLRDCFFKTCGADATNRPADCFAGDVICQHGPKECSYNRYFACAKHISTSKPSHGSLSYLPFITCMESGYSKHPETR